jgi:hypothetical protein
MHSGERELASPRLSERFARLAGIAQLTVVVCEPARKRRYRLGKSPTFASHSNIFAKPFASGIVPPLIRDNVDPLMPISLAICPFAISNFCW